MRFESIELHRYGRFTDQEIHFPRQACDFHLVLGANEAGKSTLRQAFHDVLFGIPMTTRMSFLHAGADLSLGARLSGAPGELAFGRRRKRNGGLVNAVGEPLDAEALHPWLGGVNAAFFERMFGLDHERLEQGSRRMLQAGDDVDSVLFQAAAGVASLNVVLESLRNEVGELWAARARNRAWHVAAGQYDAAVARLRAASVRPSAWAEAERELRRVEAQFAQAEEKHASLLVRMRELERLGRLAPILAQIREYEARLESADTEIASRARLAIHENELMRLVQLRVRLADYRAEIERGLSRQQMLGDQLDRLMRQMGRPNTAHDVVEPDNILAQLPSRPLRKELDQLLREARQLRAERDSAERALSERRTEVQALRLEVDQLPQVAISTALNEALESAASAGDINAQLESAQAVSLRERSALETCLARLRHPGLDLPEDPDAAITILADMQSWAPATVNAQVQRRQQLVSEVDAAALRCRESTLELQAATLAVDQFKRQYQAVSREEVLSARRGRDALWAAIHAGSAHVEAHGEQFQTLMKHADLLADQHLRAVDEAARLQGLVHEQERRQAAYDGLLKLHDLARRTLEEFDSEWNRGCTQRKLPPLLPGDMQAWQGAREAALAAHERALAASEALQQLQTRHDALLESLLVALGKESVEAVSSAGGIAATQPTTTEAGSKELPTTLRAACRLARAILQRASSVEARREAAESQLARISPLLPGLEQQFERCVASLLSCEQRRRAALERTGLSPDADDAFLEEALALLSDAEELAEQLRDCRAQCDRMQAEIAQFEHDARRMAELLGYVDLQQVSLEVLVAGWASDLEAHRQAVRMRNELKQRLDDLTERLLQAGEGRSRAQIQADLDAADLDRLSAQHELLAAEVESAAEERSRLAVEREQARAALESISGSDDAAQAEAQRQAALADMAEIGERYISLYAQQKLLERVIERYREQRQGPLLLRAGQLFARLTLGAHAGLMVDDQAQALMARRADGRLVELEGLSDGTRDQLYLSLRLAALELYLESAVPMPFIADDLFVNYDDARARAGLAQLAHVARHTQVIFLTHHAHMVDLAHEALGGEANIIELQIN